MDLAGPVPVLAHKMATSAIVTMRNLDINKVTFSEPRKNAKGGTAVSIRYDNQNFQLRIPKMKFPAGVFVREDDKTGKVDYKLMGSLAGCDPYIQSRAGDETGDFGKLYNFLRDLEEKMITSAAANSSKWFGKTRSEAVVRDTFKQILSASRDKGSSEPNGKYPPSFAMKIPVYDGQVKMQVIDSKGSPVYITTDNITEVFQKRVEATLVISPSIYIINGSSFGVSWRVEYAQVFPSERVSVRSVFMDEEEVPDEEETAAPQISAAAAFQDDVDDAPAPEQVKPPAPMPEPSAATAVPSRRKRAVA